MKMATKDEALKMAIEAMKIWNGKNVKTNTASFRIDFEGAINACKEALEQPAQEPYKFIHPYYGNLTEMLPTKKEPVGKWESKCKCDFRTKLVGDGCKYCNTEEYICKLHSDYDYLLEENEQLLAHPAPSWQGLSDDEKSEAYNSLYNVYESDNVGIGDFMLIYFAIEQALKEKNYGS